MNRNIIIILTLAASAFGCGSDEVHGHEACDAVALATTALTAGTSSAAPAAITPSTAPYQLTLPAGARGYLRLSITVDTALIAAFKSAGVLSGLRLGDVAIDVGAPAALDACTADIPAHHDLDLGTPGDYLIIVGPVAGDSAWMFLDVDAEHEHEQ